MTTRRPGIKDVAARAVVGIATVSRALSGSAEVNPALKRRVLAAASELGYRPNFLAQSLRRGATLSAGFIADDLGNHLNIDIATGAEGTLRGQAYSLLVMNSEMDSALDAENVRVLTSRSVDALMMTPVREDDPRLIDALDEIDIPVAIVEGDLPGARAVSFVVSDHRQGAVSALRHLITIQHRRIAVLTGPTDVRSARERGAAASQVQAEAGRVAKIEHVTTDLSPDGGYRACVEILGRSPAPTAMLVGGNQLLTGVLDAIAAAGLELGREISLVTTDPVALAAVFRPALATITRDSFGLGRHAAKMLLESLTDPTRPPRSLTLPTVYEPRASVAPPSG